MINQAILKRRSVRTYTDQTISKDLIEELIKAAQFSPSAVNNRSWEFLVLLNQADKDKLYEIMDSKTRQESVKQASVVLIPLINTQKSILPVQDLSLAIGHILIQAAELNLGSFWKNISAQEADDIKNTFNIPEYFSLLAVLPVGFPDQEIETHLDEEFEITKIHWNKW